MIEYLKSYVGGSFEFSLVRFKIEPPVRGKLARQIDSGIRLIQKLFSVQNLHHATMTHLLGAPRKNLNASTPRGHRCFAWVGPAFCWVAAGKLGKRLVLWS
jgi:hypothetical protein